MPNKCHASRHNPSSNKELHNHWCKTSSVLTGTSISTKNLSASGVEASTKRMPKSAMSARSSAANTLPARAVNGDLAGLTSRPTLTSLSTICECRSLLLYR